MKEETSWKFSEGIEKEIKVGDIGSIKEKLLKIRELLVSEREKKLSEIDFLHLELAKRNHGGGR